MARGKYSPTVSKAYDLSQDWWNNYAGDNLYDPEGYDSYGYNEKDFDRAGIHELDYATGPTIEEMEEWGYGINDYEEASLNRFEGLCDDAKPFEEALVNKLRELKII